MRKSALAAIAFISTCAAIQTAHACSCRPWSRAQAVKAADVVFQGRVLDVYRDGQKLFATLAVVRPVKGNLRTKIEVGTNASSAACGYPFRKGQVVVVGATFREQQYRTNMCLMNAIAK
ncbi:MAG: hypothetical protein AB7F96_04095 [Beijerinckiaceae bacterium]